ncbi:hypothetical protein PTTG_03754 [Puccinia triticina 1-1 BBBD Race 1]|uniref:Uncharacterized protein n=3 Tax=Puccinia triticina TaxID=208348 RepID=A0A180GGR2_PUCT1|nr:hypothetical protein PTTG_03754 [Puccinia triticina 1-1 BBBD Race 1]
MYLSYTANLIYTRQSELALKLQGVLFIDAVLSPSVFQEDVPIYPFVKLHQDIFKLSPTFMKELETAHKTCGYADYLEKFLKYPAPGKFPDISKVNTKKECQLWDKVSKVVPDDFDFYNIYNKDRGVDPLFSKHTYLDRPDVRKALNVANAPPWVGCSESKTIFPDNDSSPDPSGKVLPNVIAKSKRTIVAHGKFDGRLPIQGISLGLQSMTWAGKQGFTKPIDVDFKVDGKSLGNFRTERGLTYVQVSEAGHMIPQDAPVAALAIFEYLLGNRASL